MKRVFAFVFASLFVISSESFASTGTKADEKIGLLLNVDFKFKDAKKSFRIKDKFILAKEHIEWTPLTPATSGVALLAKIDKPNELGIFSAQYMIVDTTTTPVSVRQMGVISELGRRSEVANTVQETGEGVSIQLLAEETRYREKK